MFLGKIFWVLRLPQVFGEKELLEFLWILEDLFIYLFIFYFSTPVYNYNLLLSIIINEYNIIDFSVSFIFHKLPHPSSLHRKRFFSYFHFQSLCPFSSLNCLSILIGVLITPLSWNGSLQGFRQYLSDKCKGNFLVPSLLSLSRSLCNFCEKLCFTFIDTILTRIIP